MIRHPAFAFVLGAFAFCVLAGVGIWRAARVDTCPTLRKVDLDLAALGGLRRRLDRHGSMPAVPIVLDEAEVNFAVGTWFGLPVWIAPQGDAVAVDIQFQGLGGCYPLHFVGNLEAEDGALFATPTRLTVGDLDLTQLTSWRTWQLPARLMPDGPGAKMLSHVRSAHMSNGFLHASLDNPQELY